MTKHTDSEPIACSIIRDPLHTSDVVRLFTPTAVMVDRRMSMRSLGIWPLLYLVVRQLPQIVVPLSTLTSALTANTAFDLAWFDLLPRDDHSGRRFERFSPSLRVGS